jgi:hypothetical protein
MTDAVEALGEDVHEEAANELMRGPSSPLHRRSAGRGRAIRERHRSSTRTNGRRRRGDKARNRGRRIENYSELQRKIEDVNCRGTGPTPLDTGPKND